MNRIIIAIITLLSIHSHAFASPQENQTITPKPIIKHGSLDGCSFAYSPVDFCDEYHAKEISNAIKNRKPNFSKNFIVTKILERPRYEQYSIAIVDPEAWVFHPIPVDYFSKSADENIKNNGEIKFNLNSNKICLFGNIVIYRSLKSGEFCFFFEGGKFTGYQTTYMDKKEPERNN